MKTLALALVAGGFLAMSGAAHAQDACVRPEAPVAVDGAAATMEQILAAKNAVSAFMTTSDAYQACVIDGVTAQRVAAKAAKVKFDEKIAKAAEADIKSNQADKEAAGKAFNAAVKAYKTAHPG